MFSVVSVFSHIICQFQIAVDEASLILLALLGGCTEHGHIGTSHTLDNILANKLGGGDASHFAFKFKNIPWS